MWRGYGTALREPAGQTGRIGTPRATRSARMRQPANARSKVKARCLPAAGTGRLVLEGPASPKRDRHNPGISVARSPTSCQCKGSGTYAAGILHRFPAAFPEARTGLFILERDRPHPTVTKGRCHCYLGGLRFAIGGCGSRAGHHIVEQCLGPGPVEGARMEHLLIACSGGQIEALVELPSPRPCQTNSRPCRERWHRPLRRIRMLGWRGQYGAAHVQLTSSPCLS